MDIFGGMIMMDSCELPVFEFTKGKINYTITDTRLLNRVGVQCLSVCIQHMCKNKDSRECHIEFDDYIADEDINVAMDIVMGFDIKAKQKRRWSLAFRAISRVTLCKDEDGTRKLICYPSTTFSELVYSYWNETKRDIFDTRDFAVYAVDNFNKELGEAAKA